MVVEPGRIGIEDATPRVIWKAEIGSQSIFAIMIGLGKVGNENTVW
jgi:hypothetical protein